VTHPPDEDEGGAAPPVRQAAAPTITAATTRQDQPQRNSVTERGGVVDPEAARRRAAAAWRLPPVPGRTGGSDLSRADPWVPCQRGPERWSPGEVRAWADATGHIRALGFDVRPLVPSSVRRDWWYYRHEGVL
jgi:hypothetical protein